MNPTDCRHRAIPGCVQAKGSGSKSKQEEAGKEGECGFSHVRHSHLPGDMQNMQEDLDLDPPIFESVQPLHSYMAWTGEFLRFPFYFYLTGNSC